MQADKSAGASHISDEDICKLLQQQFHISCAGAYFGRPDDGKATAQMPPAGPSTATGAAQLSLEDFVTKTLPLLEMERAAEVAQVKSFLLFHDQCPHRTFCRAKSLLAAKVPAANVEKHASISNERAESCIFLSRHLHRQARRLKFIIGHIQTDVVTLNTSLF